MNTNLTPKQEGFIKDYLNCGNASEAYRKNYNASKMKPESVNRRAKELIDNSKIKARIDDLKGKIEKSFILSYEKKEQLLVQLIEMAIAEGDVNAAKGCIAEHNKMQGDLAPTKSESKNEHSGNISIEFERVFK